MVVSDKSYRHFLCDWQNFSEFHERQSEKEMKFACPAHNIMTTGNILHADSILVIGQGVRSQEERHCNPTVNQLKINIFARKQLF